MITHNREFVECGDLDNFLALCGPMTRTCKLVLEDKDFARGLQHCLLVPLSYAYSFTGYCTLSWQQFI